MNASIASAQRSRRTGEPHRRQKRTIVMRRIGSGFVVQVLPRRRQMPDLDMSSSAAKWHLMRHSLYRVVMPNMSHEHEQRACNRSITHAPGHNQPHTPAASMLQPASLTHTPQALACAAPNTQSAAACLRSTPCYYTAICSQGVLSDRGAPMAMRIETAAHFPSPWNSMLAVCTC